MGYKERVAKKKIVERLNALPREPRHRCDKYPCSDETCEHYRTPLEQELSAKIAAILKEVPEYTRATIAGAFGLDVRIVCSGAIPITAWYCCLKPGHTGQCFSSNKQVSFTPETYR